MKLKDEGVVGGLTLVVPLLLGEAGCEKVNCRPLEGALFDVGARDGWAADKVAGWEKLNPELADFVFENKPVDVTDAAPNGELDIVVVVGSGLALIIGLNNASFDGLKLNSDEPKLLLCVAFGEVPNILAVEVVEVGCLNTGCPKPTLEFAVVACPNCGCWVPNPPVSLPNPRWNTLVCPKFGPKLGASPKTEL